MHKKVLTGSLAALLVNVIFGFSFLFSKIALSVADPLIILAVRFSVAFAALNILWFTGLIRLNFRGKPKGRLILMAVMQPLLYYIFELYGIDNTSSALSGVIISLVPVIVIILSSIFLKEKAGIKQIICSVVSLCAVSCISLLSDDGSKNSLLGIGLLLGAALCAALFNILSRKESERYTPIERTYIMFLVGTVGFILLAVIGRGNEFIPLLCSATASPAFWVAIAYLSILSSVCAFLLYNFATGQIDSVRSASFSNITTVVSVLAGIFILKEQISISQLVCCLFIILGVYGVNQTNHNHR